MSGVDLDLFDGPNRLMWEYALRQAARAPSGDVCVGAALWDPRSRRLLGSGCSHSSAFRLRSCQSTHAEIHALTRSRHVDLRGAWCAVVAVKRKNSDLTWRSCPCVRCAQLLHNRGIGQVHYVEKDRDGVFALRIETPAQLLARAPEPHAAPLYSRENVIPVLRAA